MAWFYTPERDKLDEMQFHVVQWMPDGRIDRHLAICANPDLAFAAFDIAVGKWPDRAVDAGRSDRPALGDLRESRFGVRCLRHSRGEMAG